MTKRSIPKPWRVADVTFVEIEIIDRQMRIEFECGLRVVIASARLQSIISKKTLFQGPADGAPAAGVGGIY